MIAADGGDEHSLAAVVGREFDCRERVREQIVEDVKLRAMVEEVDVRHPVGKRHVVVNGAQGDDLLRRPNRQGRNSISFMMLKIAEFTPIPSASAVTAATVKPGARLSRRAAYR